MEKKMPNHIEEYFEKREENKQLQIGKELFKADKDVDIKTDLDYRELVLINAIVCNNDFLKSKGLKPVYNKFLDSYLRLKLSKERKSRIEFVTMNRQQTSEDILKDANNIQNLISPRK